MSRTGTGEALQCWKCGADVSAARLPDARAARCPACEADLHVCRLCRHYAPRLLGRCDEDRAEEVMDKERANFCDWFLPRPGAFVAARGRAGQAARGALERLFGGDPEAQAGDDGPAAARRALDDLFRKPPG